MMGKTVLITGGTSGIGKETALGLARMDATIVIIGRNREKTERVVDEIKLATGNDQIQHHLCDLASLDDVRKLAADFRSEHSQLDVLFDNAGGINTKRTLSKDGYELTFAVNHLSHFLLTDLLLDMLKQSVPSRVVVTSSAAANLGRMHWDDLMLEKNYSGFRAYSQSKLANQLFTFELARRLKGTGVTANCLHPGTVRTGFAMNNKGAFRIGYKLFSPLMISASKGAETPIYLASSPEVKDLTGTYFFKRREKTPPRMATDPEAALRLWDISERLVKKND
ncbi:MAG: SDR family oxidoreductase [Methanomassiliicoccales archaeon]|nr:SDR family oxidoreductase [Methanomassiliicoccales archaeon]